MVSALKNSWAILTLLLVTAVIRGSVLFSMRGNLEQDPDAYREIAENLIRHGEFALGGGEWYGLVDDYRPTAYRPPLYPVVLSNLAADGQRLSLVKVGLLHVGLGVATVWLTWLTARRVGQASAARAGPPQSASTDGGPAPAAGLSHPTAVVSGLLVALDPILLNQQTLVMTETLAALLAILSLWCLARFDAKQGWFEAGLAGGAIGLAILCRPTFLPWLGLVAAMHLGLRNADRGMRIGVLRGFGQRIVNVVVLVGLAAAVVAPWVIRNYRMFGKPIATTTHGGYTLWLGNNYSFYDWLKTDRSGLPWSDPIDPKLTLGLNFRSEKEQDRAFYEYAWRDIQASPRTFVRASIYRILQLWSPLPHKLTADESTSRRMLRYATCAWYCGVYVLVSLGVWWLRGGLMRPPWVWGVLLCLVFTAVHTFYWTNLRMRAPLMPFVAIVAASGWLWFAAAANHGASALLAKRRAE